MKKIMTKLCLIAMMVLTFTSVYAQEPQQQNQAKTYRLRITSHIPNKPINFKGSYVYFSGQDSDLQIINEQVTPYEITFKSNYFGAMFTPIVKDRMNPLKVEVFEVNNDGKEVHGGSVEGSYSLITESSLTGS